MDELKREGLASYAPKLSFGAKTLILEITDGHKLSRRQFLKKTVVVAGGVALFSIVLGESRHGRLEAADCSCHAGCYTNCHSDCGRKTW
ncbi:MAG: twin-arginine translocation signal domain-containing protein [Nitrospirae bacterium]|nr:twin-arginine translocation signal domain-containing protein [Nitrospirota bacterium]MCL5422519.1 twin-arginine translocation signal domain-containing protein [Nitrospirota bacterium]